MFVGSVVLQITGHSCPDAVWVKSERRPSPVVAAFLWEKPETGSTLDCMNAAAGLSLLINLIQCVVSTNNLRG